MKLHRVLLLTILLVALAFTTYGQNSKEDEVRKMEQLRVQAILKFDTTVIEKLMGKEFVLNSTSNNIINKKSAMTVFKKGHFSSYEQRIEKILVIENTGIVMGYEAYKSNTDDEFMRRIKVRFTNIWIKKENTWQIIARQETNISVK